MVNIEQINMDHKKWLHILTDARTELISLTKKNPNGFINDIGALLKSSIRLSNSILVHESKVHHKTKRSESEFSYSLSKDHKKICKEIEFLHSRVSTLKTIITKRSKAI
jgi:hypothetical protein